MGNFSGRNPANAINQNGLSAGYTSLVDDFDTYIASNPTHSVIPAPNNDWFSAPGTLTGNFDFDLGGAFTLESFALWDIGSNNASNVIGFNLLIADNAAFSGSTLLGSFTANPNTGPLTASLPEVFTFSATSGSFVRMEITSNNGGGQSGFGEAAFEIQDQTAPEPGSLALFAAAGLAFAFWRRTPFRSLRVR